MTLNHKSSEAKTKSRSEKFQTANLARCIYTLAMVIIFYIFQQPWIVFVGSIHLVFSISWFLLIEYDILIEKELWWSGYVPATFDLIWLTVLAYGTGHITSFFILGYLGSIALSSMTLDRNYGKYNAFLATVLFSGMGFLVYYEILPLVNIMMPPVKPTFLSVIISSILLGGSAFMVNKIVSRLFYSLTDVNQKLLAIAMTDPLTGISNRRSFLSNLEIEIARQQRSHSPYPISFLLFDLDHFKTINDTYGHEIGDLVLIEFASVLKNSLRKQDFPSRWGGEEFLVMLPNTDIDGAIIVAEKIRTTFHSLAINIKDKQLQSSASVGISVLENQDDLPETIIQKADQCLYEAKRRGRNQVVSEKNLKQ